MRRVLVAVLLLSLTSSVAIAAPTAEQLAAAKEHYETAQRYYNVGEFTKAIDEYKAAYEASGAAGLLFNIAQAYRLSKNVDQALFFYNSYLRASPNASNRPDVEKMIAELEASKPETHPQEPPPHPDTQPSISPPVPATQPTRPPPPPPPPPTVVKTHPQDASEVRIGRAVLIGGAVGIIGGMLFGIAASADAKKISDLAATRSNDWTAADRKIYDRGRVENGVAVTLYTLGTIAAVTGAVLWYVGGRQVRDTHVTISPTKGGAAMGFSCAF